MFYREAAPTEELAPFILSFWEFSVPGDGRQAIDHEIFPDGCVSLFYFRNAVRGGHHVGITGLHLESVTKPVSAGDTLWGMRIAPAACAGVLRRDPANLIIPPIIDAADLSHLTDGLVLRLREARGFDDAIRIFESMMKELAAAGISRDAKVAEAVDIIETARGEVRIDHLAAAVHLSPRQLQRRFKASAGLSPKQFARVRRIRATAVVVAENGRVNWAERAAEMGFSDQSHLTHEFSSVTKRTPISFAKKVSKIDHGNLVK